ncbi:MAG: hypothetical protein ACKPH7_31120, partial [Planktothrix sp.]
IGRSPLNVGIYSIIIHPNNQKPGFYRILCLLPIISNRNPKRRIFDGEIFKMRVLLDTNIILDHLLEREPFADEAIARV